MIGWLIVVMFVLAVFLVVMTTVGGSSKSKSKAQLLMKMQNVPGPVALIDLEVKTRLHKVEETVFRKADEVKKMAEDETEVIDLAPPSAAPAPFRDPCNDTAQFMTIKRKVEEIQKLSEGQP